MSIWRLLKIIASSHSIVSLVIVSTLLGCLTIWSNVGLMTVSAWLIAAAALQPAVSELSIAIVGVRFFGIARAVFRYMERWVTHDATFRMLTCIRVWLYKAVEPLAPAGLAGYRSGDLFTRMVADVETLKYFFLRVLYPPLVAILSLAGVVFFTLYIAAGLTGVIIALMIFFGLLGPAIISRWGGQAGKEAVAARAALNAALADTIQGMGDLAAFDRISGQMNKITALSERLASRQDKANQANVLAESAGFLGMNITMVVTVVLGIQLVRSGELPGVWLAALALAVQSAFEAVLPLPSVVYHLEESLAAARRLLEVADTQAAVTESREMAAVENLVPSIEVRNLAFSYQPQSKRVLNNVSFSLPPGRRLAIVGASGAGKSTLAGLVLKLWQYRQGEILLGGRSLNAIPAATVRDLVGYVGQDTYLFNASIGDNILLARPAAKPAELAAAVRAAELTDWLRTLPKNMDTMVGRNGLALSGGERQRIALARVLLKNSPILLLDEPTAALDAATAQKAMHNILQVMAGRTTMLITHHLAGLETMDEILVLDGGQVAERGTWDRLMAAKGIYYRMWSLQQNVLADGVSEAEFDRKT
ncbi:MAG TPA: thiol reductant ABC exporter subunit CydC [Methylomusa anaerophila]|uniref:Putative multidrug export ATP-binding/permease protein n=1 Tax=Methylomusa anaerophila TaxID=1930071 RepID=A0A348AH05_9FIRM|nr:thiol reductant ABC exporter subunit CydC [Methylomusa anaerophila]BBB90353.1 putative multidrug export ATP-binding/permease protein [Methylomusa anaerophila]HML89301.1 thiol reductant ABC exporter subunit CydC [Methylomusa anaerophila]